MAVLVTLWLPGAPAAAHEFSIVVVASEAAASVEARRGFRLAVDESPDVTHAPGREAGDHLGGIDVDIAIVEAREPDATGTQVAALLDAGAAAVVTLAPGPTADGVGDVAASRGALHVAVDDDPSATAPTGSVVLRRRTGGQRDGGQAEMFATAFTEEYGTPATDAAQLGYDAGRLLDGLVEEFGESLEPTSRLAAAARATQDELVAANVEVAAGATAAPEPAPSDALAGRGSSTVQLLAGAVALLVAGGAGVAVTRRARVK